jgi:hypothetical protein
MGLKYESNVNSTYLNQLAQQYGLSSAQTAGLSQAGASPVALGSSGYSLYRDPKSNTIALNQSSLVPQTTAPKPAPPPPVVNTGGGGSSSSYSSGSPLAQQTVQSAAPAGTPGVPAGSTIQNTFRDALLGQLNTNPNDIKLTDPDLAPQARAYADEQQRATEKLQQDLAEQGFAGGALGTGAYNAELANAREQQGLNTAKYNADLLGGAKAQRLSSLFNALGLGGNLIDSASSQGVQQSLGQSDIALRGQLGQQQLGLGLLQALLGDRQSNNALGLQGALGAAGLNQNALLAALGLK